MAGQLTLIRLGVVVWVGALACTGQPSESAPEPQMLPLPVATLAGQRVALFPATMVVADPALGWGEDEWGSRTERLRRTDSVLVSVLIERIPEIDWVLPDALRSAAARAPGLLSDPDRMGTAVLRSTELKTVPFPLISNMRNLTAVVGDRYALVPAAVGFEADSSGQVLARVSVVIPDLRSGRIRWRTVARGTGTGPWRALAAALVALAPPIR